MKMLPTLLSRFDKSVNLVVLILVLLIVLLLAIASTPSPDIDAKYNEATVHIKVDRAWVFVPGQCVTVSWNLEEIQSLYIDGEGNIDWGEEKLLPYIARYQPNV